VPRIDTFGIAAPGAMERTSFDEDQGSYARTIMEGMPLDIEYYSQNR
jgi:hypothetical protein